MKIGYARVSTMGQNLESQISILKDIGCEVIFSEKITGRIKDRPELDKMFNILREGDEVVITDLTRISRGTRDLFNIVDIIEKKGANIKSVREQWLDTTTTHGKLLFTIFGGLVQFEADLIRDRTIEGLRIAKEKYGRRGGRPRIDKNKIDTAIKMYDSKLHSIGKIVELTGVSKSTLYRYINNRE